VRLDPLCELELAYRNLVNVKPYGGGDGASYGEGEGTATGERLSGTARWSNHPKRRNDGVYLPDAHGVIETEDGASVLFHMRGRTWFNEEDVGRQNLVLTFESDHDRYRWLNNEVCVAEGIFDLDRNALKAHVHVCVNELV
jgi:Protein of unknown function (DUF3237)